MNRIGLILAILLLALLQMKAQCNDTERCRIRQDEPRPVTSIYSIETGAARTLSTYLSPLYYTGMDYAVSGSWTKTFNHWPDRCVMRFEAAGNYQNIKTPLHY